VSYEDRLSDAIGAVVSAALEERGASRVALLDDGSPEAALLVRWLHRSLGAPRVLAVGREDPRTGAILDAAGEETDLVEVLRLRARLVPDALVAHPGNKTALLLAGALPPDPLLPLGDVWASEVEAMAGACTLPPPVAELARRAGGVAALDRSLRAWLEGREHDALDRLGDLAGPVRECFAAGRADRIHPRVIPKLTVRTLGVDLFE